MKLGEIGSVSSTERTTFMITARLFMGIHIWYLAFPVL